MSKMGSFGSGSIRSFGLNAKSLVASITPNFVSIYEGSTVTFSIQIFEFGSGTVYWTNSGTTTSADFSDNSNSGSITITNGIGTLTRTVTSDASIELSETIIIQIRKNSVSGTILCTSSIVMVNDNPYAIVPVATSTGNYLYSQYKLVNLNTFSVDYTVTANAMDSLGGNTNGNATKVLRFGNFLLEINTLQSFASYTGRYWIKNILTNTTVSSSSLGGGGNADIVKLSNNTFGWFYSSGVSYRLATYSVNLSTGSVTQITIINFGNLSITSAIYYSTPRSSNSITIDSNYNVVRYNGIIGFSGVYDASSGYWGALGILRVSPDCTFGSVINFVPTPVNLSRPFSGMGGNGTVYTFLFDGSSYTGISSSGSFLTPSYVTGLSSNFTNSSSPILGSNNGMIGYHNSGSDLIIKLVTPTGLSTGTTITTLGYDSTNTIGSATVSGPFTIQAIANGAICIYNDAANAVKYITYNSTTSTWSSPGTITGLGNVTINATHAMIEAIGF